mmetsp:Transcript_47864/g.117276  ORF Transcript_47864/g.117276 Transcript_47864/m.117276 type:complete len:123 (-) Transcript_47864:185-553(-)
MQAVMIFVALGFASMGVTALVRPSLVPAQFGTSAQTSDARTEVRAVYGGFGVAMAVLLVVAALQPGGMRDGVALTVGIALGGMAAGRLIGMAIEPPCGWYPTTTFLAVEIVAAAALVAVAAG